MQIINKLKLFFQFLYLVYIVIIDVAIVMIIDADFPDIDFNEYLWLSPVLVISILAAIYQIKLIRYRKYIAYDKIGIDSKIKEILFSKRVITLLISYLLFNIFLFVFAIIIFVLLNERSLQNFRQTIFLFFAFSISFVSIYDSLLVVFYAFPKATNKTIFKRFVPTKRKLLNLVLIFVLITQSGLFVYSYILNPVPFTEVIERYDDNSIKELNYYPDRRINNLFLLREYYNSGNLKSKVIVEDDYLSGVKKEYYENGNLNYLLNFIKGDLNGIQKSYYPNGKLFVISHYNNDNNEGEFNKIEYEYPDTEVVDFCKGYYKNNKKDSLWKWWDKDSNLIAVEKYFNDKLEGEQLQFHYNGKKSFVLYYENDSLLGAVRAFDINGKQTMDRGNGQYIRYFKNGNIEAIIRYKDSLPDGDSKYYYRNGNRRMVVRYRGGIDMGLVDLFDSSGVSIKP